MDVLVTTHYAKDDPECCGDYWSVDVVVDGAIVAQYGDDYHDKGEERAEGYTDAILNFFPDAVITYTDIADAE